MTDVIEETDEKKEAEIVEETADEKVETVTEATEATEEDKTAEEPEIIEIDTSTEVRRRVRTNQNTKRRALYFGKYLLEKWIFAMLVELHRAWSKVEAKGEQNFRGMRAERRRDGGVGRFYRFFS